MTGKDILKTDELASLYDKIEESAIQKLDTLFPDGETELTEEQANKYELIADFKYNSQFYLQTADLYIQRLKEL